jgi:hypothetical protein
MIVGLMLTFPLARIIFFDIENVLDNFLLVNIPRSHEILLTLRT